MKMLIAIDPSLSCSGIAVLSSATDLVGISRIKPKMEGNDRFKEIAVKFKIILEKYKPDVMAIETQFVPFNMPFTNSFLKVSQVRGIFEGVFYSVNPLGKVLYVHPMHAKLTDGTKKKRSRKEFKKEMIIEVKKLFAAIGKITNDEADAIGIGLAAFSKNAL